MSDMPTGMFRRGAAYYTRRRIPKAILGEYAGRKEIVRALGTNDYREAKRRHALLWVELDQEFAKATSRLASGQAAAADPHAHIYEKLRQIAEVNARRSSLPPPHLAQVEYDRECAELSFREEFEEDVRYDFRGLDRDKLRAILRVTDDALLSPEQLALRDILRDADLEVQVAQDRVRDAERRAERRTGTNDATPVKSPPTNPRRD